MFLNAVQLENFIKAANRHVIGECLDKLRQKGIARGPTIGQSGGPVQESTHEILRKIFKEVKEKLGRPVDGPWDSAEVGKVENTAPLCAEFAQIIQDGFKACA